MAQFIVKPIVCDYGVYNTEKPEMICLCNIKRNAELIAAVLEADQGNPIVATTFNELTWDKAKEGKELKTHEKEVLNMMFNITRKMIESTHEISLNDGWPLTPGDLFCLAEKLGIEYDEFG